MNYTEHYSKLRTPQSEQADPRQQQNNAGGFSFVVDDWMRLQRFLILGAEGGTYYVKTPQLVRANAKCVERCLDLDGAKAVEMIASVSEAGRAPKNSPAIFALAIAAAHSNPVTRKAALMAMPRVCRIGTHLFEFCTAVSAMRGWGRGLRSAIAHWYRDKNPDQLAYQVLKYQQRAGWSHRDVLRKAHAEPRAPGGPEDKHAALFRWLVRAELGERAVDRKAEGAKTYAAVTGLPSMVVAYEELKRAETAKQVVALIAEHGFTHEMIPTQFKGDVDVWEALLQKMPMTAMIRNLGKMTSIGLLKPMSQAAKLVAECLADEARLRSARVHPIAVLSALMVYKGGAGIKGSLAWQPVGQVTDALDEAFYLAFGNVESTGKNTLLALDVSGSMSGAYGGGPMLGCPGLSPRSASAAMAMVTARTEPTHQFMAFSGGFVPLNITKSQRLDDVVHSVSGLPFDRTDCALPMLYAAGENIDVDTFVIYCADKETEILTADGWKLYSALHEGEEVYTLNHDTALGEWQRVTAVNVFPEASREMVHMEGRGHSSLTTLDHRWPVRHRGNSAWGRRWKTSETLNQADYIQCAARDAGLPVEPRWSDSFVELVAWAWTEGNWNSSGALNICQSVSVNPVNCERIREALFDLYGPACEGSMHPHRFSDKQLWVETSPRETGQVFWCINKAGSRLFAECLSIPEKVVSVRWLRTLTHEQLELFIEVSMSADGHAAKQRLAQTSWQRAESFAFACLLVGKSVSYKPIDNRHHKMLEIGVLQRYQFAPMQHAVNKDGRPFKVERVQHTGIVWCPTTPNGTWLARRNGSVYWTGNTDSETWFGNIHPYQALQAYRNKSGRAAKLIVVGMVANEFTIADPSDGGMMDCVGFDTATPQVMSDFVRADVQG